MSVGPFHRWLVATQLEPAFRKHATLQRAQVLVLPRLWRAGDRAELMIFYGVSSAVDLDAALEALARDTQDPNLPPGLSNFDLYVDAPQYVFCARDSFRGLQREPEFGTFEALDAFAVYGAFVRGPTGEVSCLRFDANLGARIDGVV